jgi:signal transduction histidine kinase
LHRDILFQTLQSLRLKWLALLLVGAVTLVLLPWSLITYRPTPSFYGPRALYSMVVLSCLLTLLGRRTLLRLLASEHQPIRTTWRSLLLFELCAPLYLAAGVLIGVSAAVLTAMITQIFLQSYTMWHRAISWRHACYQLSTTTIIVFIATTTYSRVAGFALNYHDLNQYSSATESSEFLGSLLAAGVMLSLLSLAYFPLYRVYSRASARVPVLRFQALALSIGILLPVVDIYDNITGEVAWLFFLVPLFVIYALMLAYVRLDIRTEALERSTSDVTVARHRQKELSTYAALVIHVQEEERRRLSRDLLDETAEALIAISRGMETLTHTSGGMFLSEPDAAWLKSLRTLADQTLEGLRNTCQNLRPSVLDDLGLQAALAWLCDTFRVRGVPCTFSCVGLPRSMHAEAEIAVFRIAQEALSNVWRHADATQVQVTLQYENECVDLTISDNGRGFAHDHTPSEPFREQHGGLGMRGMHERAALIGALLTITSSPGTGCMVRLSVPSS